MDIYAVIKNLKRHEIFFAIFCFLGVLAPGVLIIFQFRPDLFHTLDSFKILSLGLAITIPLAYANSLILGLIWDTEKYGYFQSAALGCFLTFILTYPLVFLAYTFGFRFRAFLWLLILLEAIVFIYAARKQYKSVHHDKK